MHRGAGSHAEHGGQVRVEVVLVEWVLVDRSSFGRVVLSFSTPILIHHVFGHALFW
jgi:hypothetical protein